MRMTRRQAAAAMLGGGATLARPRPAWAAWPMDGPMTIVVVWPPGSSFDIVGRLVADGLRRKYGAAVVVDNRTGASGNIGQAHVARARPDGYTFGVTTPGPAANNMLTFRSLPYNPLTDFTGITRLTRESQVLVVGRSLRVQSFKEFLAHARANPGRVQMGFPGNGSYSHMTQLALQELAGVAFNLIPYRGPPQVLQDMLAGNVDAGMALAGNFMPQIRSGDLTPLAVVSATRDPFLPDVPTLVEEGFDFVSQPWSGMQGPKGMPREIVAEMNRAVREILTDSTSIARLQGFGITPSPSTPEEMDRMILDEVNKWRPIIEKYRITLD